MRKFAEMVKSGEMAQVTFDEWLKETDVSSLPEDVPRNVNVIRRPRGVRGPK